MTRRQLLLTAASVTAPAIARDRKYADAAREFLDTLIDKGTDVKLPFVGSAPDLGADEFGAVKPPTNTGGSSGVAGSGPGGSGSGGGGASSTAGAGNAGGASSAGTGNGGGGAYGKWS